MISTFLTSHELFGSFASPQIGLPSLISEHASISGLFPTVVIS
jgi:hypothetical protein